jgi:hypothetical protein
LETPAYNTSDYARQAQNGRGLGVGGTANAPIFDASQLAIDNGPRAVSNSAALPRVSTLEMRVEAQSQNVSNGFAAIDQRLRRIEEALGL